MFSSAPNKTIKWVVIPSRVDVKAATLPILNLLPDIIHHYEYRRNL